MNSDPEARLIRCFASIFDGLTTEQMRSITVETHPAWDSLTSVILVAVLEEEFNMQIDPLDMPQLSSFSSVKEYVTDKLDGSVPSFSREQP
jgi:acyl carrier protein